jgi:hypothetical protein
VTTGDRTKQLLLIAAEIALVLVILGLLVAIWMPAIVGVHPDRIAQ